MRVCEQLVNRMGCGDLSRTALLLCDSDLAAVAFWLGANGASLQHSFSLRLRLTATNTMSA